MAKSAAITLPDSTIAAQAAFKVICTATNGDTDAYVVACQPIIYPSGQANGSNAASAGSVMASLTSSNGLAVTGSGGTAVLSWDAVVFVPQGSGAADQDWEVGAFLTWSTGEVTAATHAHVTVSHQP
jgi:hypothetical protein